MSPPPDNDIVNINENYKHIQLNNDNLDINKPIEERFPWIVRFTKAMCSSVGSKSYQLLENLLLIYIQNISSAVAACSESNEAIKLRNHMSNTLTFFHFYWQDIKGHIDDHSVYLNKMSVLMGIYIDLELRSSRQADELHFIAAKLFNALSIYLYNSEEHIFRVLLTIKLIRKRYAKIFNYIFTKSFSNLSKRTERITDMRYIKYLLVLKLWENIKQGSRNKKKINEIALRILGPQMPKLHERILKFIPTPPIGHENETLWLMQPDSFDLKVACERYTQLEEEINNSVYAKRSHTSKMQVSADRRVLQANPLHIENDFQEMHALNDIHKNQLTCQGSNNVSNHIIAGNKNANDIQSVIPENRSRKSRPVSKIKPGEVILIDLTEENETSAACESRRRRRQSRRNLEWLKTIRKQHKAQKLLNVVKYTNGIKIAYIHSTQDSSNSVNVDQSNVQNLSAQDIKPSNDKEDYLQNNAHRGGESTTGSKQCNDSKDTVQQNLHDFCTSCLNHNEVRHNRLAHVLQLLKLVRQIMKARAGLVSENVDRDDKLLSPHDLFLEGSKNCTANNKNACGKEDVLPLDESSPGSLPLPEMCQNCTDEAQRVKGELAHGINCNTLPKPENSYSDSVTTACTIDCPLYSTKATDTHNTQIVELKQKLLNNFHQYYNCYHKVSAETCVYDNSSSPYINTFKDTALGMACDNMDKKPIFYEDIRNVLSDLDKCMDVLNRISEHLSVHAEKQRSACFHRRTDTSALTTAFVRDQTIETSTNCRLHDFNSFGVDKFDKALGACVKEECVHICQSQELCKSHLRSVPNQSECIQNIVNSKEETRTCICCWIISLVNRDNSFGVLNYITDVLMKSMNCVANKKEELRETYNTGTTQLHENIPNTIDTFKSLLNVGLTMNQIFNDFIYSNKETVDQCPLKTTVNNDPFSINESNDGSSCVPRKENPLFESTNTVNTFFKQENEAQETQKDRVPNSIDIVAFGLNTDEEEAFELSTLEDEPTTFGRSITSSLCQSPLLMHSNLTLSELIELLPASTSVHSFQDRIVDIEEEEFESLTHLLNSPLTEDTPSALLTNSLLENRDDVSTTNDYTPIYLNQAQSPSTLVNRTMPNVDIFSSTSLQSSSCVPSTILHHGVNECQNDPTQRSVLSLRHPWTDTNRNFKIANSWETSFPSYYLKLIQNQHVPYYRMLYWLTIVIFNSRYKMIYNGLYRIKEEHRSKIVFSWKIKHIL